MPGTAPVGLVIIGKLALCCEVLMTHFGQQKAITSLKQYNSFEWLVLHNQDWTGFVTSIRHLPLNILQRIWIPDFVQM